MNSVSDAAKKRKKKKRAEEAYHKKWRQYIDALRQKGQYRSFA